MAARNLLGETFGTRKLEQQIRSMERNQVDVRSLDPLAGLIGDRLDAKAAQLMPTDGMGFPPPAPPPAAPPSLAGSDARARARGCRGCRGPVRGRGCVPGACHPAVQRCGPGAQRGVRLQRP